ncbi:MAG: ABC transporter ATP-binding protein [Mollicutes bacterium]|nr:ABC transporter ATP-binding protein [Mollicutes bacterium]
MEEILKITNVSKSFGKIKAVNNISFKVKKGEMFAYLGVNGAGKSTTISMICGTLKNDNGNIIVCGEDINKNSKYIKNKIGVVFQNSVLDQTLSVYDNLKYRASLYDITGNEFKKRFEELSKMFELNEIKNQKVKTLSGGQRRRVDIARAIIHEPEFLILDEPTTGLDPNTRKKLWNIIRNLREKNGMTVFLTTHYMEEAVDADFIIIIEKGKIITEGTPLDLKNKYAKDIINIYHIEEHDVMKLKLPYTKIRDGFKIEVENTSIATDLIIKNKEIFKDYEIIKGKMDDVFLNATGSNLEV